jgi:hypothetical protein
MRMKAKTSPTGYIATLRGEGGDTIEYPVVKFDEQGYALILGIDGRLLRAAEDSDFLDAFPMLVPGK